MKYFYDEKENRILKIKDFVAYDEITGIEFNYNMMEHYENLVPLLQSSYEKILLNMALYHLTENENCIDEANEELLKYGV